MNTPAGLSATERRADTPDGLQRRARLAFDETDVFGEFGYWNYHSLIRQAWQESLMGDDRQCTDELKDRFGDDDEKASFILSTIGHDMFFRDIGNHPEAHVEFWRWVLREFFDGSARLALRTKGEL